MYCDSSNNSTHFVRLQGIIELYEFQKKYPTAESKVNAYLSQTGTYFQSYIRRGLSNLAAEDNELRQNVQTTPPSVPSTPTTVTSHVLSSPTTATHNTDQGSYPSSSSPRNHSPPLVSSSPTLQEQQQQKQQQQSQQQQYRQSFDINRLSSTSGVRTSIHAGKIISIHEV